MEADSKQSCEQNQNERAAQAPFVFWFLLGLILVAIDQIAKFLSFHLKSDQVAGRFIWRQNFFNYRFAFSLPVPGMAMAVIYALVLGGFGWYAVTRWRLFGRLQSLAAVLILAGGLSNVAERAALGGVRDFLAIRLSAWTGYYNLADFYILAGIVLLLATPMLTKRSSY